MRAAKLGSIDALRRLTTLARDSGGAVFTEILPVALYHLRTKRRPRVLDMHDPDPDTRIAYLCLRILDHGSRLALQRCAVHPSAKALAHSLELVDVFR